MAFPIAGCLGEPVDPADADGSSDAYADLERATRSEPPPLASYPDYGDRVDSTIGYDGIDPENDEIYLEPSTRTITPGEPIAFELENGRQETLKLNFYDWRIHSWVDGEWIRVAPQGSNDPLMQLTSGEAHTWTITVDNEGIEAGAPVPHVGGTADVTVPGLGGGHYAFGTSGWFEGQSHEEKTAFVARFELEADPLPLAPSDAIQETEWEGDTLVATTDRGEPDHHRLGEYELARVEEPTAEARRVLTEHVVRDHQLRDALALALEHDARRVRLVEYNGWTPIFGVHDVQSYEYRGASFDVTARELEG